MPGEKWMSEGRSALLHRLSPRTLLGGEGDPVEGLSTCLQVLRGTERAKVSTGDPDDPDHLHDPELAEAALTHPALAEAVWEPGLPEAASRLEVGSAALGRECSAPSAEVASGSCLLILLLLEVSESIWMGWSRSPGVGAWGGRSFPGSSCRSAGARAAMAAELAGATADWPPSVAAVAAESAAEEAAELAEWRVRREGGRADLGKASTGDAESGVRVPAAADVFALAGPGMGQSPGVAGSLGHTPPAAADPVLGGPSMRKLGAAAAGGPAEGGAGPGTCWPPADKPQQLAAPAEG